MSAERPESKGAMRLRLIAAAGECEACWATVRLTIDHKLPRSRGGTDDEENLWVLCRPCNSSKGQLTVDEWRAAKALRA